MSNYMTLLGAEQVQSAGGRMAGAAEDMLRAAGSIDDSLFRFLNRFEEQVCRMEQAAEKIAAAQESAR